MLGEYANIASEHNEDHTLFSPVRDYWKQQIDSKVMYLKSKMAMLKVKNLFQTK